MYIKNVKISGRLRIQFSCFIRCICCLDEGTCDIGGSPLQENLCIDVFRCMDNV